MAVQDDVRFDVHIWAWANGAFDWFPLASGIDAEAAEVLRKTALWDLDIAETQTETETESETAGTKAEPETAAASIPPVTFPLTEADEYAVWMRYPSAGGKVPWGLIADHLTPEQTRAYTGNPRIQLNVQPAAGSPDEAAPDEAGTDEPSASDTSPAPGAR